MNFPNLPGASLPAAGRREADEAGCDPAEIERRLGALSEAEIVSVRPEWLEATVAQAAAVRPTVRRSGPFRRLLAAAVAMLGVQGMLAAATVATVGAGVVVAAVVWTAGRNSNETMSYAMALEILSRGDQPEEHRVTALTQVLPRVRAVVATLQALADDPEGDPELVAAARAGMASLRQPPSFAGRVDGMALDPLGGVLEACRATDRPLSERLRSVAMAVAAARQGLSTINEAPDAGTSLRSNLDAVQTRVRKLLGEDRSSP